MRAHLIITNNSSFEIVEKKNVVGVFKEDESKKLSEKTRVDIFSDLSCIRKGDYIFFHNIDKKGIIGVYIVTELPFFDDADIGFEKNAPYRFVVEPLGNMIFENFVPEEIVFSDKDVSRKYKTIFYKKVLNRGKVCTHLLPEETENLINLLVKYNGNKKKSNLINENERYKKPDSSRYIQPLFEGDSDILRYEKQLEWWLSYNIDKEEKCKLFIDNVNDIESFSNYMPLSISGSNLDFLVLHHRKIGDERNIRYKVTIIELKRGICDIGGIIELEKYTKWISENIVNNEIDIIQPVLISYGYEDVVKEKTKHWNLSLKKPILIEYKKINNNDLLLSKAEL